MKGDGRGPEHVTDDELDSLIGDLLLGKAGQWEAPPGSTLEGAFLHRVRYHGVAALLHEQGPQDASWPLKIIHALRSDAVGHAIWELSHQQVLTRLVLALAEKNIAPLFFKGTALAYDLYANPVWRSRGDSDLLVAPRDLNQFRDIALSQGFQREHAVPGEFISYEECWTLQGQDGAAHALDVHRKINNSELLSRLFTYDELLKSARPIPALCAGAVGLGHVQALLVACMHRAVHANSPYYTEGVPYYGGNRLIWLYDIHLLSRALTEQDWTVFVALARGKGLAGICLDGLQWTQSIFGTDVPAVVKSALATPSNEKPTIYLTSGRLRQEWMNFKALEGASTKTVFLKELIFPPEAYMRWKYPDAAASSLIALYARRSVGGVAKRLGLSRAEK